MQNPYSRVFGLTGIIGSGKSTVADLLQQKGALIIRADVLVSQILDPQYGRHDVIKNKIYTMIKKNRGKDQADVIFQGGKINRRKLAEIVFSGMKMTMELNKIMHPEVSRLFAKIIQSTPLDKRIIIYDVPLLFETGLNKKVRKNIVVYAPEDIAIKRASQRMGLSIEEVKKRLKHQISIEEKRSMADYVLDNTGNLQDSGKETEKLWKYLQDQQ
ncbi:MAG: dephospho-CoA kinase [Spirochaetia bacterium]|nr:dephospho-CoA kinase [Spirochaetia bacterium]